MAVDGTEPAVDAAVERYGFDWKIAYPESDVMEAVGSWAMPTTVWIDAGGNIRRVEIGVQSPADLDRWTAELVED